MLLYCCAVVRCVAVVVSIVFILSKQFFTLWFGCFLRSVLVIPLALSFFVSHLFPRFFSSFFFFFRHIVFAWRQWWWWWCLLLSLLLPFIRQSVYCGNNIHFGNTLTEPVTTILGGPDLYIDIGSTINLTCIVRHLPEPPSAILWSHKNQVCKSSLNTWR